ncbi:hypothetical protein FRC02_008952 [Tulasnella sp. 418]|nr:hypothetical protein FRC02_008952 [Tulasnella sp. 418]
MSSTLERPPQAHVSGDTTPTEPSDQVSFPSASSSQESLEKKFSTGEFVVTEKAVEEDGLYDIDQGWDGYMENDMPDKKDRKFMRNLRYQVMNVYRRLFSIVFLVNLGVLIHVAVEGSKADYIGKVVIANIFVSVLIREEHVVNALFYMFTAIPKSWPLWIRVFTARVYSLGGIHSGSAVAAWMWLIYFTVQVSKDLAHHNKASIELCVVTYLILVLVCLIIGLAMPAWRRVHHDQFEMVHRVSTSSDS